MSQQTQSTQVELILHTALFDKQASCIEFFLFRFNK